MLRQASLLVEDADVALSLHFYFLTARLQRHKCNIWIALSALPLAFFSSCALVSLSLSVTGETDEKQSEDKEDAVQSN